MIQPSSSSPKSDSRRPRRRESTHEAPPPLESSALEQVRTKLNQIVACADALLRRREPRDVELAVAQIKNDCAAVLALVEDPLSATDGNSPSPKLSSGAGKRDGVSPSQVAESGSAPTISANKTSNGSVKGHVLLVEDDHDLQVFGQLLLANQGYEVQLAGTSEEALQQLSDRVDLVLMDLRLPDVDGDVTARMMRSRGFDGAIVALSGDKADWEDLKAAGFDAYVSKLAPLEEIVKVCHIEVESRRKPSADESQAAAQKFAALRRAYAEKLPRVVVVMRQCWGSNDRKQLISIAHRLNGTCALYGMADIGSSAQRLKQALDQSKAQADIEKCLAELERRIHDVCV